MSTADDVTKALLEEKEKAKTITPDEYLQLSKIRYDEQQGNVEPGLLDKVKGFLGNLGGADNPPAIEDLRAKAGTQLPLLQSKEKAKTLTPDELQALSKSRFDAMQAEKTAAPPSAPQGQPGVDLTREENVDLKKQVGTGLSGIGGYNRVGVKDAGAAGFIGEIKKLVGQPTDPKEEADVAELRGKVADAEKTYYEAKDGIRNQEIADKVIAALGNLAMGFMGMKSLENPNSQGLNFKDYKIESHDFKDQYDRAMQEMAIAKKTINDQIEQRRASATSLRQDRQVNLSALEGGARAAQGESELGLKAATSNQSAALAADENKIKAASLLGRPTDKNPEEIKKDRGAARAKLIELGKDPTFNKIDSATAFQTANAIGQEAGVPKALLDQMTADAQSGKMVGGVKGLFGGDEDRAAYVSRVTAEATRWADGKVLLVKAGPDGQPIAKWLPRSDFMAQNKMMGMGFNIIRHEP